MDSGESALKPAPVFQPHDPVYKSPRSSLCQSSLSKTLMNLESNNGSSRTKVHHRRSRSYVIDSDSCDLFSPAHKHTHSDETDDNQRVVMLEFHHDVFDSVKSGDIERLRDILDRDSNEAKWLSLDGLSLADIAILLNYQNIYTLLLTHGATPNLLSNYKNYTNIPYTLDKLISETQHHIAVLSGLVGSKNKQDVQMRLENWKEKRRVYKKMRHNYSVSDYGSPPGKIKIKVTSRTSLNVRFSQPAKNQTLLAVRIFYRVRWSADINFASSHTFELIAPAAVSSELNINLTNLVPLTQYYIQISTINVKGVSDMSSTDVITHSSSSWRDSKRVTSPQRSFSCERVQELSEQLDIFTRNNDDMNSLQFSPVISPERKSKWGFRHLFSEHKNKFFRHAKRGVYLAAVIFSEEKILITEEDRSIPMIEVTENFNTALLHTDMCWLNKVTSNWFNVRQLQLELSRLSANGHTQFRSSLLSAVIQLQNMIGIQDLGHLHHRAVRDNDAVILVMSRQTAEVKSMPITPVLKWGSILKTYKYIQPMDSLLPKLNEFMLYAQANNSSLLPGLYLGYLKARASMHEIQVMVSDINPNTLPYVNIREESHVTKAEWNSLVGLEDELSIGGQISESNDILDFKKQVIRAAQKLTDGLDVPTELIAEHRIYNQELIEFSPIVSFIILLPPPEQVCTIRDPHRESCLHEPTKRDDLIFINIKQFELSHMKTYAPEFSELHSQLAVKINIDMLAAQQKSREALTSDEIESCETKLSNLKAILYEVEELWHPARWATDVLASGRDRRKSHVHLKQLYKSVLLQTAHIQERMSPAPSPDEEGTLPQHSPLLRLTNSQNERFLKTASLPLINHDMLSVPPSTISPQRDSGYAEDS